MTQPKTFAKEMYGMDYDEKMKLLVALKDNSIESRAIIDTFPFSQSTFRRIHARRAIWCRLVHLKMIGVKCQPTDKDVEGIDTTASSVKIEKKLKMCMRACKWSTTPLIFATEREINSQVNLIFILKYFIIYVLDTLPYHNN